jgi:hypothetical protein
VARAGRRVRLSSIGQGGSGLAVIASCCDQRGSALFDRVGEPAYLYATRCAIAQAARIHGHVTCDQTEPARRTAGRIAERANRGEAGLVGTVVADRLCETTRRARRDSVNNVVEPLPLKVITMKRIALYASFPLSLALGGCIADRTEPDVETGEVREALNSATVGYVWADQPTASSYTPSSTYQVNFTGASNTITRNGVGAYTITFPGLGGDYSPGGGGTVNVTAYGWGSESCKVQSWWYAPGASVLVNVLCFDTKGAPVDTYFSATFTIYPTPLNDARFAYAWADQPYAPSYTPSTLYQHNSEGQAALTITRGGTGDYTVRIPGMTQQVSFSTPPGNGGSVTVTAYGTGPESCKVGNWWFDSTDAYVHVYCFIPAGAPVDTMFTMTYHSHESLFSLLGGHGSYAWANQPLAASYTPSLYYQYDDSSITIARTGVGQYTATFPSKGEAGGNVQVTAYGTGPDRCKVGGWWPSSADELVEINCFNASGNPEDSMYTVAFTR